MLPTRIFPVGPNPPYDAEVEYLESTGTQVVNAGVGYFADFEVDIRLRESVPNRALGINANNCLQRINQLSPYWRFTIGGENTDTNVRIVERHVMAWKSGKIMADGAVLVSKTKLYSTGAFQLFGASGKGYPNMIYGCRLYDASGVLVRDLAPCRVGSVGYLYDRANPTGGPLGNGLYGSATDTPLIAGPDVT